jgi:hypothetical protein
VEMYRNDLSQSLTCRYVRPVGRARTLLTRNAR